MNIYDLHPYNRWVNWIGLGAYHTGIEIHGIEYSFGYNTSGGTGVFEVQPREAGNARFRESRELGEIKLTHADVYTVIETLKPIFMGSDYDLLTRNCNHFCVELAAALGVKAPPSYLTRLAGCAYAFKCFIPERYQKPGLIQPLYGGAGRDSSSSTGSLGDLSEVDPSGIEPKVEKKSSRR